MYEVDNAERMSVPWNAKEKPRISVMWDGLFFGWIKFLYKYWGRHVLQKGKNLNKKKGSTRVKGCLIFIFTNNFVFENKNNTVCFFLANNNKVCLNWCFGRMHFKNFFFRIFFFKWKIKMTFILVYLAGSFYFGNKIYIF